MVYQYGYPLYDEEDAIDAYLYLFYDINKPTKFDRACVLNQEEFYESTHNQNLLNLLIVRANIKKVMRTSYTLIDKLVRTCEVAGYRCEIHVFNPDSIIMTINNLKHSDDKKSQKFYKKLDKMIEYISENALNY